MVLNGPEQHPGANFVEDEGGNLVDLCKQAFAWCVSDWFARLLASHRFCSSEKEQVPAGSPREDSVDAILILRRVSGRQ